MLSQAARPEVGCVGAKLYYPNDLIQHGGVIVGLGGVAGHSHRMYRRDSIGYFGRLKMVQNVSAVTAACMMIRKDIFEEVGEFDERFVITFNDVDLCLKDPAARVSYCLDPLRRTLSSRIKNPRSGGNGRKKDKICRGS